MYKRFAAIFAVIVIIIIICTILARREFVNDMTFPSLNNCEISIKFNGNTVDINPMIEKEALSEILKEQVAFKSLSLSQRIWSTADYGNVYSIMIYGIETPYTLLIVIPRERPDKAIAIGTSVVYNIYGGEELVEFAENYLR